MEVLKAIKERRSIRKFLDKEIPKAAIDALIEAILWAPSAGNLQSRRFYFVSNMDIKRNLAKAALNQDFIYQAPLTVVACLDTRIRRYYGERGTELYAVQDVSASIQNLMLEAVELGLGSVWVGAFYEEEVRKILNLPEYLRPISIIPVGYPANKPMPPSRVSKEEMVRIVE